VGDKWGYPEWGGGGEGIKGVYRGGMGIAIEEGHYAKANKNHTE